MLPAHAVVTTPGATPMHTAFILHGILGSGRNWRAFARQLARLHPTWRLVLVDLRNHGDSNPAPPPHTVAACADDLVELAEELGHPTLVIGHSYGGKVAMAYGRLAPEGLAGVWVLDSQPGAPGFLPADHDVARVIAALEKVTLPVPSHAALQEELLGQGFSPMMAGWMTTNLRREPAGLVWRFDLAAVSEMLSDYVRDDLWPWLEEPGVAVDVVRGGRSDRWSEADIARLERLPGVSLHTLPEAGHWLHVDAPAALLQLLDCGLRIHQ